MPDSIAGPTSASQRARLRTHRDLLGRPGEVALALWLRQQQRLKGAAQGPRSHNARFCEHGSQRFAIPRRRTERYVWRPGLPRPRSPLARLAAQSHAGRGPARAQLQRGGSRRRFTLPPRSPSSRVLLPRPPAQLNFALPRATARGLRLHRQHLPFHYLVKRQVNHAHDHEHPHHSN
jgi:hypothetical protein